MEEQALYRAILAAPHDDTPRLVYADWLDEAADQFPEPAARTRRARAEFIRVGCALTRAGGGGWRQPWGPGTLDLPLLRREKRLLFTQGRKWRRAVPASVASSPFDRGFLRPCRAFTPLTFPRDTDEPFFAAPLWDVHLYATDHRHLDATDHRNDPHADRGQYGELLSEVGRSPALARVGWLQVSFFHTPTAEFLRTGNFANVETLVLNCGPFPQVLEAVAANESFRNLRYVRFGRDRWAWAGEIEAFVWYAAIAPKLEAANARHLSYGEMRAALRAVLGEAAAEPPPPELRPLIFPPPPRIPLGHAGSAAETRGSGTGLAALGCLFFLLGLFGSAFGLFPSRHTPTMPTMYIPAIKPINLDAYKFVMPEMPPIPDLRAQQRSEALEALRKAGLPVWPPPEIGGTGKLPLAPPPRRVPGKGE